MADSLWVDIAKSIEDLVCVGFYLKFWEDFLLFDVTLDLGFQIILYILENNVLNQLIRIRFRVEKVQYLHYIVTVFNFKKYLVFPWELLADFLNPLPGNLSIIGDIICFKDIS